MLPDVFDELVQALTDGMPVSLSRWGDGEWHALLGHPGANEDGQAYTAPLRQDLTAVLCDRPTYRLALQPFAWRHMGPQIQVWLDCHALQPDWVDGELFTRRSRAGTLTQFLAALDASAPVLVGPDYLSGLRLFRVARHVVVPQRGCYDVWEAVCLAIVQALVETRARVVLLSAGMSANLLVHALAATHPEVSAVDCGSLWEPYVGRSTRRYHAAILARERVRA